MTDEMERIWAEDPDIFDDMGIYYTSKTKGLVEYVRGDIVQKLIGERDRQYDENVHRIAEQAKVDAENAQLRAALNQSRMAFAGYVSVKSAIDLIDYIIPREDKSAK